MSKVYITDFISGLPISNREHYSKNLIRYLNKSSQCSFMKSKSLSKGYYIDSEDIMFLMGLIAVRNTPNGKNLVEGVTYGELINYLESFGLFNVPKYFRRFADTYVMPTYKNFPSIVKFNGQKIIHARNTGVRSIKYFCRESTIESTDDLIGFFKVWFYNWYFDRDNESLRSKFSKVLGKDFVMEGGWIDFSQETKTHLINDDVPMTSEEVAKCEEILRWNGVPTGDTEECESCTEEDERDDNTTDEELIGDTEGAVIEEESKVTPEYLLAMTSDMEQDYITYLLSTNIPNTQEVLAHFSALKVILIENSRKCGN